MQNSVNHRIKTYCLPITVLIVYVLLTWWAETSICPIRAMTGLPCPGCGLTTAATALIRGDILTALQSNAMIFIVPPVLMLAVIDVCKKKSGTIPDHPLDIFEYRIDHVHIFRRQNDHVLSRRQLSDEY